MGVFSELDMEMRQGDTPFAEDSPFAENDLGISSGPIDEADPFADDNPFAEPTETEPFVIQQTTPAAGSAAPVFEDDARQQAEADAAPAVLAQLNKAAEEDAEEPDNAENTAATEEDEDAGRKAHEEAEAKRKAEWDAKQAEKKAAMQEQLDRLAAMSDDEVMEASTQRIGADTERLTRRNMKECISEHIQTLCLSDAAFARKVYHPKKSMIHCVWYINRKAREFAEQEMKDNGFKPENGIYGCDVPDGLVYQWAEEYFNDPNAKEDEEKEEKFVSKPYVGGKSSSKSKSKAKKEKPKKETAKKPAEKPAAKPDPIDEAQMSLLGAAV